MAKEKITISEGLDWLKALEQRKVELVNLRTENTHRTRYGGAEGAFSVPLYNVVALDKQVTKLTREINKLKSALKKTNATTEVGNYEADDEILGELELASS